MKKFKLTYDNGDPDLILTIGEFQELGEDHHYYVDRLQYTGFKTSDGKEIYDRDLVKCQGDELYIVYWNYQKGNWSLGSIDTDGDISYEDNLYNMYPEKIIN